MSVISIPKSFKANIDRALHNLYQEKRTTLHPMLAIPIYYRRMFKGDQMTFGIVESLLQSEPTFAPLMANWRLQFEWYFDSDANRYGWIDNNTRLTSEEVMNRVHHRKRLPVVSEGTYIVDAEVVGRGGVDDYAGIAPDFVRVVQDESAITDYDSSPYSACNIDFHLTYLNIIRNYHVNKQFPMIPYVATNLGAGGDDFNYYPLDLMDDLFMFLRSCPNGVYFEQLDHQPEDGNRCDAPSELQTYYADAITRFIDWLRACGHSFGGLFCTQFEPDLYQNLLARDNNLLRSIVTTQTLDGQTGITIEQFRLKNHLQGLYDKIFVSGGTDRELSRTIWGIESNRDYDIPELLCVHSEIIGTNLITSTTAGAASYNGESIENAPGSMSGNINARRGKGRMQKFTAKTSGSLMCIVTLTPLVDYQQNIERHLIEYNFMDEFTPDMARKGFEDVPMGDYCALPHTEDDFYHETPIGDSIGKQVAWLREMTAVNRAHGEFSNGGEKEDWILRRDFQIVDGGLESVPIVTSSFSPYGNPLAFQYPFVSQSIADPNFYLQVGIMNKAYRPIPRRFMPNLGY